MNVCEATFIASWIHDYQLQNNVFKNKSRYILLDMSTVRKHTILDSGRSVECIFFNLSIYTRNHRLQRPSLLQLWCRICEDRHSVAKQNPTEHIIFFTHNLNIEIFFSNWTTKMVKFTLHSVYRIIDHIINSVKHTAFVASYKYRNWTLDVFRYFNRTLT